MVKEDCFAYKEKYCSALIEMVCRKSDCPFFKPKEIVQRQIEEEERIERSVEAKRLLKVLENDFNRGLTNKQIARLRNLDQKDVARKKYYLRNKGRIK